MFKRANVAMLPTNEKASLIYSNSLLNKLSYGELSPINCTHYHLYFTSDDKIEKGDCYISDTNEVKRADNITHKSCKCKKIIATTDTSIEIKSEQAGDNAWYNPYPKPSDSFISKYIEEYNKGNIITDVMVEYELKHTGWTEDQSEYTYDEFLKINPKDNTITIKRIKDSWSREEVGFLIDKAVRPFLAYAFSTEAARDEWLYNWLKENIY